MESKSDLFREGYHWGTDVTIISALIIIFTIVLSFSLLTKLSGYLWLRIGVVLLLVLPLIYAITLAPIHIGVAENCIYVKKIIGKVSVPINEVVAIEKIDKSFLSGSIRHGSGGFFGYFGKFKNNKIGKYNMQITETKNLIIVKTEKNIFVFNCRNSEELVKIFYSISTYR